MVLPLGRVADDAGLVEVRDWRPNFRVPDPAGLVEDFNERVERDGPIVVDRNHAELYAWFGRETPAAGWLLELELRDDGIYGRTDWTPRGAEEVASREYGYTSSVVSLQWATTSEGERDYETPPEVSRITGLSLVNTPATYTKWLTQLRAEPEAFMAGFGLAPFSAEAAARLRGWTDSTTKRITQRTVEAVVGSSVREPAAASFFLHSGPVGQQREDQPMPDIPDLSPAALTVLDKLGLAPDASTEQVDAALARLSSASGQAVADLSRQVGLLTQDAAARKTAERDQRIEAALSKAIDEGRLTPAGLDVYRELGRRNGPELLEQALGALPSAPLDTRLGVLELEDGGRQPIAEDVSSFAAAWGLSNDEMQLAVEQRDRIPEPRLLDTTTVNYGDAVMVGA